MRRYLPLILILLLAASLRLVALGVIPRGFTPDEASQGYSAYSLLKTGRDEWGISWPLLSFKSFLDYKAPLQTYLMLPFVAIFGLTEFAVRLPAALLGILAVFSLYRLVLLLAQRLLRDPHPHKPEMIALTAALLLAISPWQLQFSRMGLEAGLAGSLTLTGLWFFFEALKAKEKPEAKYWFWGSAIFLGLTLYAYHSAKIFTPLLVVWLIYLFGQKQWRLKPEFKSFLLIFALLAAPGLLDLFFGSGGTRGQDLLVFKLSDPEIQEISNQRFFSPLFKFSPLLPAIFHNKLVYVLDRLLENFFSYTSLSFWFSEGGREITYSIIPGRGLLFTWSVVLFIAGLIFGARYYLTRKLGWLLLGWFILAALPAIITKEGFRPNRAAGYLGWFEIVMAFGTSYLLIKLGQWKQLFVGSIVIVAVIAGIYYLNDYAFAAQIKFPGAMAYGWRDAASYLQTHQDEYDQIFVEKGGQAQSMVAFYTRLDPKVFQGNSVTWAAEASAQGVAYLDQMEFYRLDRYSFKHLNFPEDIRPYSLYLSPGPFELLPKERKTLYLVTSGPDRPQLEFFTFDSSPTP